jgi:elongation factor G
MMARDYPLERYRNIGIIAHIDAGKTTTTERVLFYTGKTYRLGSVDEGTTVTDWMEQERERGITIVSAAVSAEWKGYQINIIDTPGHIDFTAEVQRSLRVLDGGVVIFDAVQGVEPQSETVWRQADRYGVPRICFVNKMDRVGASYERTIDSIRDRLGANPIAMQIPLGFEASFHGVINVLEQNVTLWEDDDLGKDPKVIELSDEYKEQAQEARAQLVERIAELDDELTVKYLEGEEISLEELKAALRRSVIAGKATPVFCGSALRNKGIQILLDAVIDCLPSPADVPPVRGVNPDNEEEVIELPADDGAPMSALVFKIVTDPYVGRLAYFRVYSGVVNQGAMVLNASNGKRERVGRLLRMYADRREDITEVRAGDIGAVLGFKQTFTGDTLCENKKVLLENITFPEPVISIAIEPKSTADQDKMGDALHKLSEEDPTFRVRSDENTGQTIISGMGELHLDVLIDRMLREFKVQANVGRPRVAYRESITRPVEKLSHKYVKQTGGRGQYGHVVISLEPGERGSGVLFESKIVGGAIPKEYIPAVEKGIMEAADSGVLAGYPVVDMKITLTDGSYHEVDSSEMAFKIAASMAFKEGVQKGAPVLLEPMMKVEVVVPEEFLGDIIGQINGRRGNVLGMEMRPGNAQAIRAMVPLAEMFGYATELRSGTQGRGVFSMEFDHYQPVSESVMQEMLK